MTDDRWEREALREVALEGIKERRRARRWGVFFKLATLVYLVAVLVSVRSCQEAGLAAMEGRHTAVVDVYGTIAADADASAERIIEGLNAAFEADNVAGVVLRINSPGGSPVQAGQINDEIYRLRAEYPEIPIYAAVEDVCASGAYYIAVAADRIYVDKASMVGSIGVLMNSFGFTEAMEKLGIERRLYTAGENKAFLDPFSLEEPDHVEHVREMLAAVHQQFIEVVREGRGERLVAEPEIFSGLIWTGVRSIELGLADELGSVRGIAREVIGAERLVNYTPRQPLLDRIGSDFGVSAGRAAAAFFSSQTGLR